VEFLNEEAGTFRTPDGGLLPTAGRVASLDTIVSSGEPYWQKPSPQKDA
jgi:hypothetical protein